VTTQAGVTHRLAGKDFMFEGLFQPLHLLVIFGIALLVFGPKKLPELGKGIGEGIRGFKSAMHGDEHVPPGA
jgi:sec-independent protein translocase protein TatA